MNAYELRIAGVENDARLAAARWELFACPEIRDLYRIDGTDRVAILYEGAEPDVRRWVGLLEHAGYQVKSPEPAEPPPAAA